MNHDLKADVDLLIKLCETELVDIEGECIRRELLNFISYLSASDGTITDDEVLFLHQYLQEDYSPLELSQYIEENNTYSVAFETTVPETLQRFTEKERGEASTGKMLKDSASLAYIRVMEQLGTEFLACDGSTAESEETAYNTYISMLKKYGDLALRENETTESIPSEEMDKTSSGTEEPQGEKDLNALLAELNQLIGLEKVKKDVVALIHLQEMQRVRKKRGLKQIPVSKHLVFYGNPGTGKTTVARLLAKIYHAIGILSAGTLVEVDRSGLVGGYVGQTALKTKEVIDRAVGGVLFVDEAYSLSYSDSGNDYGQEAIDTLLKGMEDNRENLVVIVAGYPDLMQKFIDSNPGLRSRFNKYIHFEDYNPAELVEIFKGLCKKSGYAIDADALERVSELLEARYNSKTSNFANGREVRNIFEKIVLNQANRLFGETNVSNEELCRIVLSDIVIR